MKTEEKHFTCLNGRDFYLKTFSVVHSVDDSSTQDFIQFNVLERKPFKGPKGYYSESLVGTDWLLVDNGVFFVTEDDYAVDYDDEYDGAISVLLCKYCLQDT